MTQKTNNYPRMLDRLLDIGRGVAEMQSALDQRPESANPQLVHGHSDAIARSLLANHSGDLMLLAAVQVPPIEVPEMAQRIGCLVSRCTHLGPTA